MLLSHDDRPWAFGSFTLEVRRGWALLPWDASWESRFCPTEDSAQPSWLSNTCSSWRSLLNSQTLWKPESGPKQRRWKAEAHLGLHLRLLLTEEELGAPNWSQRLPFCGPHLPHPSFPACCCPQTSVHSWEPSVQKLTKWCKFLSSRKKLTFLSLNATQWGMASRKPERTLSVRL